MKKRLNMLSASSLAIFLTLGSAVAVLAQEFTFPSTPFKHGSVPETYDFPATRYGECPLTPILFGHRDGRGRVVRLEKSYPRIGVAFPGFANAAGGGCTPNDRAMIVYRDRHYNGRSLTIDPGTVYPRFSDEINNDVTSVRLYKVLDDGSWELIPE